MQRDLFTGRWRQSAAKPDKEAQMQIELVSLLKWCKRDDVIMFHVPNGEERDKRVAAKLKAMGVLPGVSDLVFLWKEIDEREFETRKYLRVLFLELKLPGRQTTEDQVEFGLAARVTGADFAVARSIDQALAELEQRGLLRKDRRIGALR